MLIIIIDKKLKLYLENPLLGATSFSLSLILAEF